MSLVTSEQTPRARALAYWTRVRDALPPAELAAIRRRGGGAELDAPPIDCRALEVEPDLWEFYRVVRTPSDMPNTERWEFRYCAPMFYEQPGRYYMPIGSTAEDVWRRHFPRTLDQLVIIDAT